MTRARRDGLMSAAEDARMRDGLMSAAEYARMRDAEDVHWWYLALRSLVAHELRRWGGRGGAPRVLDAGCGTGGGLARWTRTLGTRCYGIDLAHEALSRCRERGERLIAQASVEALPFRGDAFDAVVSLDVLCLEGIDESRALAEIRRVLRPGGLLVLNLPAFEILRGQHDRAVRIRRRFARDEVEGLVRANGFRVVRASYWNTILFPAVWLIRRLRRSGGRPTSDLLGLPVPMNATLAWLLQVERKLLGAVQPPFGTSVLCVATRA